MSQSAVSMRLCNRERIVDEVIIHKQQIPSNGNSPFADLPPVYTSLMEAKARKGVFVYPSLRKQSLNFPTDRLNLRTDREGDWKG